MEWTIEAFAEEFGYNPEYVRAMCRKHVNNHGTEAKLPEGFEALPPRGWLIIKKEG